LGGFGELEGPGEVSAGGVVVGGVVDEGGDEGEAAAEEGEVVLCGGEEAGVAVLELGG
jgi:hypothetical protein